ncbi:hypothetical protein BIFBIF_00372 [Bifidobacterium bifidum ATCC 29521 = JCM 1255 = DSM 20456]|nr:hypothetical protein BIFBIF_00372 [Bifidobacterium bifidum ATCC 29521 = JCM 1255 = DSM 20456]
MFGGVHFDNTLTVSTHDDVCADCRSHYRPEGKVICVTLL